MDGLSTIEVQCPRCDSFRISKNGHTRHGKRNFRCRDCGRQFVIGPRGRIPTSLKTLILKMLKETGERVSVPLIARVTSVSESAIYVMKRNRTNE